MAQVTLDVFYDGQCPFCIESMNRVKSLDSSDRLHFVDLNLPEVAAVADGRFTPAELAEEMHVRLPDGSWRIGYYGWAAIVGALPGRGRLAKLMLFPPIAEIGRTVYRLFAKRRYTVSRLLGMPAPCDSSGACKIQPQTRTTQRP